MRRRDGSLVTTRDGGAYLHRLRDRDTHGRSGIRTVTIRVPRRSPTEAFARLAAEHEAFGARFPIRLRDLAADLGVSIAALEQLRTGWTGRDWSWPMLEARGNVVGIRYRGPARPGVGASRWCEPGSQLGVIGTPPANGPIVVVEGESDAAAARDLGIQAIAVPGAGMAGDVVRELVMGRDLVLVVDADEPGHEGGHQLARACFAPAMSVRILEAPRPAKDLREAVVQGMTPTEFRAAVDLSAPWVPQRPVLLDFESYCIALDARERFHG